ncbi:MAG: transcription-repair coupling factor [Candidatus Schekmanbacteria bacterium]|nr:transcription-repair coupling factor [Candidatus Schekmanbacteria bacterium]
MAINNNSIKERSLFNLELWLTPILDKLHHGQKRVSLKGLWGGARGLLIAGLHVMQERPVLVITASAVEGAALFQDIKFFHKLLTAQITDKTIAYFPSWEILPYEPLSPQNEIVAQRLHLLYQLLMGEGNPLIVTPLTAVMQRLIPRQVLGNVAELLAVGEEIEREKLLAKLQQAGYQAVDMVERQEEFSIRGGIIDLWGPGYDHPVRVELFGDEIASLRFFDYESQRSLQDLNEITILPASEAILSQQTIERLKQNIQHLNLGESILQEELLTRLELKQHFAGIEQYLPFLYEKTETLFDYLSDDTIIVQDEPEYLEKQGADFEHKTHQEFHQIGKTPYPAPDLAYLTWEQCKRAVSRHPLIDLTSLSITKEKEAAAPLQYEVKSIKLADIHIKMQKEQSHLAQVSKRIGEWIDQGERVLVVCGSEGQAQRMQEVFLDYDLVAALVINLHWNWQQKATDEERLLITVGDLPGGFRLPGEFFTIISEGDIFGEVKKQRPRSAYRSSRFLSTFSDLQVGDYVVHVDHGIGRYLGLTKLELENRILDFLLIEYQDNDKLYVPLDRLYLVQKYMSGDSERQIELHKLGGKKWERQKAQIKADLLAMADEVIRISAARKVLGGHAFAPDTHWQKEFEAAFEYTETPDQLRVIEEVKNDMEQEKPMDRLVCGDVGYGKTEVAIRAAFKAATDGKQVAVLVPTTILAQQHYKNFSQRFASYPFKVEMFSRFRSLKERKDIIQGLKDGTIDVIIGTHSLLQEGTKFANLGLLVVDEEQHFGVRHKEKIKALKSEVDVLTMTATPIPRTLHYALSGMRDLSIIDTPPEGRMDIHTEVAAFDKSLIREAIMREIGRGGQVFFVHNRVENIEQIADQIRHLAPEARLVVAHGQMSEHVLEGIMLDFISGKYDVLISTTIIESGLDISRANTIIINRADAFGLAQLYQLRGRVGRSTQRAYAYLLIPPGQILNDNARKRLKVIKELSQLGAGFRIAAHDLEIRGAGNVLGAEQSGQIDMIGFDLYCQMLDEAMNEIKGQAAQARIEPLLELNLNARLSEEYIPDTNQRLTMYKRLSTVENEAELQRLVDELKDRYGRPPIDAALLLEIMALKIVLRRLGVTKVQRENKAYRFSFSEHTPISPQKVVGLVQKNPRIMSITPENQLVVKQAHFEEDQVCREIRGILDRLK